MRTRADLPGEPIDRLRLALQIADAVRRDPHWFEHGGGEDAARTADALRAEVLTLADGLLEARSAAIADLLEDESVRAVAARLDMLPATLHKAHRAWRARGHRTPQLTPSADGDAVPKLTS